MLDWRNCESSPEIRMLLNRHITYKNIAAIGLVAMFFSCTNNATEIQGLLLDKNHPVGIAVELNHVYRDSGRITSKLITPKLMDFSNRRAHPYNEFPNGIILISYGDSSKDSITIKGDFCLTYTKTSISRLKGNVVIINHADASKLETTQLIWDQNTDYLFSEDKFTLTTPEDVIHGVGFESKKDLSKFIAKRQTSQHLIKEQ